MNNLAEDAALTEIREDLKKRLFEFLDRTDDPVLDGMVPNKEGMPDVPQWIGGADGHFRLADDDPTDGREVSFT